MCAALRPDPHERREFVRKSLKAQIDAKPRGILLKEAAYRSDLFRCGCLAYLHARDGGLMETNKGRHIGRKIIRRGKE